MNKYKLVVCGGTFDLFHAGHKSFIQDALASSEKVLLGITDDGYIQNFKNNLGVEDFQSRKFAVERFLSLIGASDRVQIVGINNAYEPYLETSINYEAIIVTQQTEKAAIEINAKRLQNGIPQLEVVVSQMKKAQDGGIISSTRIRNGEINREGKLYLNPEWQNKNLVLPEGLRSTLQKPWGKLLVDIPQDIDGTKTVVVGDATAEKFNQKSVGQFLSIVDLLIKREIKFHQVSEIGFGNQEVLQIKNPHGEITSELVKAVQATFSTENQTVILIDGEDDLAVLPVLLIAPLDFNIFYGQPNEGLVQVVVTEENKEKAYQLASKFTS
jgi:pantetheine-phosphate adenylyltransferase